MITAETIDRIIEFRGNGLPVVSLYVPVDPGMSQTRHTPDVIDELSEAVIDEGG